MHLIYLFSILSFIGYTKCELPIKINVESEDEHVILVTALFTKINWMMKEMDQINKKIDEHNKSFNTTLNKLLQNQPLKEIRNSLVILRRQDGSENFDRNWLDYKNGFGNPNGEFFIGLDKLHAITTYREPQELFIILRDFENKTRYAKYDHFVVGNEEEEYKILKISNFSGDAGDAFSKHLNWPFSTKDQDNDTNCAKTWKGGWWFNNCYYTHLTAPYYHKPTANEKNGIIWDTWHDVHYSLKFVEMILIPKS